MPVNKMLDSVALKLPRLIMPSGDVDLRRFSVIACDQFSSQPEYWQETEAIVGDAPSALRLILPEAYLPDVDGAITASAQKAMTEYLCSGLLTDIGEAFVFVHRETSSGVRRGLVVALDLEQYDYSASASGLVRTTEGTVVDRLPARVAVRSKAALEIPHVMVLIDDPENRLMSLLDEARAGLPRLYDFELMQSGGKITGWRVDDPRLLESIAQELEAQNQSGDGMLYAVGDGNHSLAAAKQFWESLKPTLTPDEQASHPARYSMVELVNLYDDALLFEPIHRLLIGVSREQAQSELGFDLQNPPSLETLQPMLDDWLKKHPEASLDYIHGREDCLELGSRPGNLAIILPDFEKHTLFERVRQSGALARKSFSMGSARDKRYYLESRAIK